MICLLKLSPLKDVWGGDSWGKELTHNPGDEIAGWIIAHDVPDARRQAYAAFENDLATELYQIEFTPTPGKRVLRSGYVMLVSP